MNVSRMKSRRGPSKSRGAAQLGKRSCGRAGLITKLLRNANYFGSSSNPVAGDLKYKSDYFEKYGSPSTLQLELLGTIADKSGRGYAIIEERDKKKQSLFKVGIRCRGNPQGVRRNAVRPERER